MVYDDNVSRRSNPSLALVTGGSRGLGRAIAEALLQAGYRVLITARSQAALEATRAGLAHMGVIEAIAGDVSDRHHRDALAARARELGGLAVLINNAAILGPTPRPSLLDLSPEALGELFAINAIAPVALLQALHPHLQPDACIINISSDASPVSYPEWGGYVASKAALDHLSATLAIENPHWFIYAVDPGEMRTQMYEASAPGLDLSYLDEPSQSVPTILRLLEQRPPSGRYLAKPGFARSDRTPRVEDTLQPIGVLRADTSAHGTVVAELDPARFDASDLAGLGAGTRIDLLYRLEHSPLAVISDVPGRFANPAAPRPNPVGVTRARVVEVGRHHLILADCHLAEGVAVYDLVPTRASAR